MSTLSNGKSVIHRLHSLWRGIVVQGGATREIGYRLEKLSARLDAVVDKIFIKTVKARDMLLECLQMTEQFQIELDRHANTDYRLLTRLERRIDELVRKTYEFRIKAG
jgi:hypothetical protein